MFGQLPLAIGYYVRYCKYTFFFYKAQKIKQ